MVNEIDRSDFETTKIIEPKLSWRENFAATIVLLIGIVFLALQVLNMISSKGNDYSVEQNTVSINKSELFHDIRFYLTAFLGVFGSLLMFRKKTTGWVIGISFLIFFALIAIWGVITAASMQLFDLSFYAAAGGLFILTLSIIFLLLPSARKKYRVGKRAFLPTLVFLMAIAALFLFLQ